MSTKQPESRRRWLPYLFAAGGVFWLIQLTQFAAYLINPLGRDQLVQALAGAGFQRNAAQLLMVEAVIIVFLEVCAAVLHGAAFYGLRRFAAWGWVAATLVAAAWSFVLVGIPILIFLLRRQTRQAYGVP